MQPDAEALAACCRDVLAAKSGHGRRWAVARCVRALQAAPVMPASPMVDEMTARAMVAVAETINRTTVSPLKPGA
jgi:hypothetical protein